MKRLLIATFFIWMLIITAAFAEEPLAIHIEGVHAEPSGLSIYFNTNMNQEVTDSMLSVRLGGTELLIQELNTIDSSNQGITYLFLADISGSIKKQQLYDMKEIMNSIANHVEDKDNAAIMLVGNDTQTTTFDYGRDKLPDKIDSIEKSADDTNLYAAIIKALDLLNTSNSIQQKKCLIIISDGIDDYTTGYTREEVNTKIKEVHVPIYTIAMLKSNASSEAIEKSKILGSFARLSTGGIDSTFGVDQSSADDISDNIVSSLLKGYVLLVDTSSLELTNDQSLLDISLNSDDFGKASDEYMLNSSDVKVVITPTPTIEAVQSTGATMSTVTPSVSDSTGTDSTDTDSTDYSSYIYPIIITSIIVIACIAVVILIVLSEKKKGKKNQKIDVNKSSIDVDNSPLTVSKSGDNLRAKLTMHFTKVGLSEDKKYSIPLDSEIIIGRDSSKAQFVFSGDDLLSARHCKITYTNNKLYIEDLNSTNGTYLNGIPLQQPRMLEQDDIIMLGSMELRINWIKNN